MAFRPEKATLFLRLTWLASDGGVASGLLRILINFVNTLLLLLMTASPALAIGWRANGGFVPKATLERLAERYPDIKSPQDLENLLIDLGRRQPVLSLGAQLLGGVWVLTGDPAGLIIDIDIEMVTRLLKQPVYGTVQTYVGQVDAPETRAKVTNVVESYMRRRGYPENHVDLTASTSAEGISYVLKVQEGDPCVIDKVNLGVKLPPLTYLDIRPGDLCDLDEAESQISALETLLRDRGYNQVRLELGSVDYHRKSGSASLNVTGTLGQKVRYEVVDQTHRFLIDDLFGDEDLTKIDPTIVGPDAMGAELIRRYRNHGFLDMTSRGPDVKHGAGDEVVYTYQVDPGKQYILKGIQFEGVTVFSEKELLDTMGLESLWQSSRPFNYDEVQSGITALKARYQQVGYWDAKVREMGQQKDKDTGTVRLTIQVEEGPERILKSLTIRGAGGVSTEELAPLLKTTAGAPLDRANLVDFQQGVRAAYVARGYLYTEVAIDLTPVPVKKTLQVEVTAKITEGPRVKIGDITIIGLTRTHDKVVRRELLFARGDWYDPEKISLSRQALTRLGIFRSVQIVPTGRNALAEKEKELDITIDVREGRPGNVSFGPGWSLQKGWNYGAEAGYSDIGGVGRQASVRGSISEERDQAAIGPKTLLGRKIGAGYTEPWVLGLPVDASIRAKQEAEWGADRLWDLSYGGEVEFLHKLRWILPGSSISTFYGQKVAKTEGSTQTLNDLLASDERIGQIGIRYKMDFRDNIKFPTEGNSLETELSWARYPLGGDVRYFRWSAAGSAYHAFTSTWVLALGIELASFEGIDRRGDNLGILPPQERLLSGGDTVRGYKPGSLGPFVRSAAFNVEGGRCSVSTPTTPLGGTTRTTIKTELRHKLSDSFAVIGFIDNGNVFLSQDQVSKFGKAYAEPVFDPEQRPECRKRQANDGSVAPFSATRSIQNNLPYEYTDLLTNPRNFWTKHYFGYGLSLGLLTALGSVNLTYGLPWHDPSSETCSKDPSSCNPLIKTDGPWWRRGEILVNVGARF